MKIECNLFLIPLHIFFAPITIDLKWATKLINYRSKCHLFDFTNNCYIFCFVAKLTIIRSSFFIFFSRNIISFVLCVCVCVRENIFHFPPALINGFRGNFRCASSRGRSSTVGGVRGCRTEGERWRDAAPDKYQISIPPNQQASRP